MNDTVFINNEPIAEPLVFICAGSYKQAALKAKSKGHKEFVYLDSVSKLSEAVASGANVKVLLTGSYYFNQDSVNIVNLCKDFNVSCYEC